MSHTTIAATRDYLPGHDKGELSNPAQSASFTVDPLLAPIKTSQLPKPVLPDPTPSENPELFDQSTRHPNTHYHPEAKLSKKKRAKKLGTGYVAKPHGGSHGSGGVHAGGRTFSEHEKEAHERAERRDAAIGHAEDEDEFETDSEGDEAQEEEQSHAQHHENRITGSEEGNTQQPKSKRNDNKSAEGKDEDKEGQEGGDDKEKDDKSDNPSLMQRATNVLSSAQQRASDVASSVTSTAMSTAQSVPVLGTLLSKVGLGAAKTDDKSSEKEGDKADKGSDDQLGDEGGEGQSQKSGGGGGEPNKKVGGQKAKDVEKVTKGAGAQATAETATKGGNEVYGKEGARQDNNEGALDKSRSQAGQHDDNLKAQ